MDHTRRELSWWRRRGPWLGLLVSVLLLATWQSRWPQVALGALWDHAWCMTHVTHKEWSPNGEFEATVTNFSCGGAAGAVSEVVQLRAADDPWGQFSHT